MPGRATQASDRRLKRRSALRRRRRRRRRRGPRHPHVAADHSLGCPARSKQQLAGWLFLAPAIVYLLFAFATPIVYNVALSFERTRSRRSGASTLHGPDSPTTRRMFNDPIAQSAIVHTLRVHRRLPRRAVHHRPFPRPAVQQPHFRAAPSRARSIIVPWLVPLIVTGVIFRFLFQQEGGAINQAADGRGPDPQSDRLARTTRTTPC